MSGNAPTIVPITLPILIAEETELQQLRAAGTPPTAGRPGTRNLSDESTRRLAIIAQMRDLYTELRADKRRTAP
ncbi:MAG: hypothetical protein AB7R89_19760 [Dehalococcoidia bacterium]